MDEVERRVNSMGSRPVLLRVGSSNYQQALPQYLDGLLDTAALPGDQEQLQACECSQRGTAKAGGCARQKLSGPLSICETEVDQLEQQVRNRHEEVLGEQGFALPHREGSIGKHVKKNPLKPFRAPSETQLKAEQSFALKSIWPLISRGRFRRVAEARSPATGGIGETRLLVTQRNPGLFFDAGVDTAMAKRL